jgi:uncharacterized protein (TIGR00369 family)
MTSRAPAVQDHYPSDFSHCYGCGRLNDHGLRIKSAWEGDEVVTWFEPRPYHIALPGFVYGGLLASLVDCHAMAAAAAWSERAAGFMVTASLKVDYLKPTPLGGALEVRARVRESSERKAVVEVTVATQGAVTVRGEVVAVRMPATMMR